MFFGFAPPNNKTSLALLAIEDHDHQVLDAAAEAPRDRLEVVVNRGVEIASEVADGPYSVILDQVTNGVAIRMAVLYLLLGGASGAEA